MSPRVEFTPVVFGNYDKRHALSSVATARATDFGITYKESEKEIAKKTVFKIIPKEKFEEVVSASSAVVILQGLAKTVVEVFSALSKSIKNLKIKHNFSKFHSTYGFFFNALDIFVSSYGAYQGSIGGYKAYKIHDGEGVRHHGVNVVSCSSNIAGIITGAAAFGMKIQATKVAAPAAASLNAKAAVLTTAATGLGAIAYGAYAIYEGLGLKRIWAAATRLKDSLIGDKTPEEKYIAGLKSMESLITITSDERMDIANKAKHNPDVIRSETEKLLLKKHKKLERRVGADFALYIQENLETLIEGMNSKDPAAKTMAIAASGALLSKYRCILNKEITLKIFKVVGAVLGVVASLVALSTPIGAGIIFGLSTIALMVGWVGDTRWKVENYDEVNILGYKFFGYKIPTASEVFESIKAKAEEKTSRTEAIQLRVDDVYGDALRMIREDAMRLSLGRVDRYAA